MLENIVLAVTGGALTILVGVVGYIARETRADVRAHTGELSEIKVTLAKITTHLHIEG